MNKMDSKKLMVVKASAMNKYRCIVLFDPNKVEKIQRSLTQTQKADFFIYRDSKTHIRIFLAACEVIENSPRWYQLNINYHNEAYKIAQTRDGVKFKLLVAQGFDALKDYLIDYLIEKHPSVDFKAMQLHFLPHQFPEWQSQIEREGDVK